MKKAKNSNKQTHPQIQGFNLIEVLLAVTFFSLAFSGMLLGSTAMINTSTNGTKINEDAAVTGSMYTGINAQSPYFEANNAQVDTLTPGSTPTGDVDTPAGDIATRQTLILPDNTVQPRAAVKNASGVVTTPAIADTGTDNRRFFYDRWVYSDLNTPDVKTTQINVYNSIAATARPIRSIVRKLDHREECFIMGVEGSVFFPSLGRPCTGWNAGINVPQATAMVLTGSLNAVGVREQNQLRDFRINGALPLLVTGNRLLQWPTPPIPAVPITPPLTDTDRGHQIASGLTAEYWIEATPNVAYDLVVRLRKTSPTQTYTVSINQQYGAAIDCGVEGIIAPPNCQRKTITRNIGAEDLAVDQPFGVKFEHIMPFSDGTLRVFKIRVSSTDTGTFAASVDIPPTVIHAIHKSLAKISNIPT